MGKTLHGIMLAGLCFALAGCGETPTPAPAPPKGLVEMVTVPAGEFVMGNGSGFDCGPPHAGIWHSGQSDLFKDRKIS